MGKTVLVVCSHPDDETLGAGGAIARHVAEGDSVYAMYFTTGLGSRDGIDDDRHGESKGVYSTIIPGSIGRRKAHAQAAADVLGFKWHAKLDYPDNAMDTSSLLSVVKYVEEAIDTLQPELVYTHHGGDLNIDHAVVYRAVMTATRPLPEQIVREVRLMEVPSSTEFSLTPFKPNLWLAITEEQAARKHVALGCYKDELRQYPHPRSHEAIGYNELRRAAEGGVGPLAEAFNVVRRRL